MSLDWKKESKPLIVIASVFLILYFAPFESSRIRSSVMESLYLAQWYAREHVILCLIPAFFIAGAIAVFINQSAVIKYFGAKANKFLSYGVASVSGSILAVCSCTVLPLFAGIYRMGAGIGPASAFLYAGPAVNVLAVILTARILGVELGIARAIGAIIFSIVIGLLMQIFFNKEEKEKAGSGMAVPGAEEETRPLWQNLIYFASMVGILVFANWGKPDDSASLWNVIYDYKWHLTVIFAIVLDIALILWFGIKWWKIVTLAAIIYITAELSPGLPIIHFAVGALGLSVITASNKGEASEWFSESWGFAKQIMPLLFFGVIVAGLLLGRPSGDGLIPSEWVYSFVGGNSLRANIFASVLGAFMYFATLTEVPILQGLIGNGMGKGPALALLLAGPAVSLPNMLVIRSVIGTKKTVVFVVLVIFMATLSGWIYGMF
ncbi:MAG: hypothetical protein GF307_08300 [candidate division Zixibacteria bacterium]|nr:hypothetical protein [candidate division Zixibacteria bacterium]